jgi:hypothetical protein
VDVETNAIEHAFFRLLGRLIPGEDIFDRFSSDTEGAAERLRHVRVIAEHALEAPSLTAT